MHPFDFDDTRGALSSLMFLDIGDFVQSRLWHLMQKHHAETEPLYTVHYEVNLTQTHQFIVDVISEVLSQRYGMCVVGWRNGFHASTAILDEIHKLLTDSIDLSWFCSSFHARTVQVAFNGQLLFLIPCLIKSTNN